MIVCDTGPLVSALNRAERQRHRFAVELLTHLGRDILVPWPVLVEVDLLMRSRGHEDAALQFGDSLLAGVHQLDAPTFPELELALRLARRYQGSGADLPDLSVMAMASVRKASILTWDFRHFRAVVLRRGHRWPLVVEEDELPDP
ncbi:MAG: PIN domain-containing protein [Gammaproteobacteria bacterium]|nr:PIN domain-containing protein [Gammaproteobacteria bacterium]